MLGQYEVMLIVIIIIMALTNTSNVIAQSRNVTNETEIGKNQSISGRISGLAEDFQFGR
jgi:hypothetical protein